MGQDRADRNPFVGLAAVNRNPGQFESRAAEIALRRKWAELLKAKALDDSDGAQMVSGHYIANPWKALGKAAHGLMGSYAQSKASEEERALAADREAAFTEGIANMPKAQVMPNGVPMDDEGNPYPVSTKDPTAQDWMQWGGQMSQLGPMGQQIGGAAMGNALNTMLPKTPVLPDYEAKEIPVGDGMKQLAYFDKRNPSKPPILVGQPSKDEKKPGQLEQRVALSQELHSLMAKPNQTPEERLRVAALTTALNQIDVTAAGDVPAATNRADIAARTSGVTPQGNVGVTMPVVPGAAQPAPLPAPSVNGQPGLGVIPPDVQRERDMKALELKKAERAQYPEGTPARTALETDIAQTEAKINGTPPPPKAAPEKPADPYAKYRPENGGDPRNAPYLPRVPGPGVTMLGQSTAHIEKLNTKVAELGKVARDEQIPVLDSAWADFEKAMASMRLAAEKNPKLVNRPDEGSILARMQQGLGFGGVGGPAGIYNIVPNIATTAEGRNLRNAVERLKAFERNRLFGQTLTGNEKMSFEQMAGTLFGMTTADFEAAMQRMRDGFEKGKESVYGSFPQMVVEEYKKGAQIGPSGSVPFRPWAQNKQGAF